MASYISQTVLLSSDTCPARLNRTSGACAGKRLGNNKKQV